MVAVASVWPVVKRPLLMPSLLRFSVPAIWNTSRPRVPEEVVVQSLEPVSV